jgi:hypothetical protein
MMVENRIQVRHLPGIKSNFGINDRLEYLPTVIMEEKKPLWQAIVSNAKTFVEGQQSKMLSLPSFESLNLFRFGYGGVTNINPRTNASIFRTLEDVLLLAIILRI